MGVRLYSRTHTGRVISGVGLILFPSVERLWQLIILGQPDTSVNSS